MSYACPQMRVKLAEVADEEEDLPVVKYDEDDHEEEDVDVLLVQRESLLVRRVLATY